MTYIHTPAQARALVAQMDRVNGARSDANLAMQLTEARERIAKLERRINELELLLCSYEDSAPAVPQPARGLWHHGERVITAAEAAQLAGVSLSTVSRYCASGFWRAHRDASNRWLIVATGTLPVKHR